MVGGAVAAEAAVEAEHAVAGASHHLQIVGDLQDRPALAATQLVEEGVELLGGAGIEAGLGLIEHQQAAGAHHAAGQQHPLELATGELRQQPVGQVGAEGLAQGLANGAATGLAAQPGQGQARGIPAEADELGHREREAAAGDQGLGQVGEPGAQLTWQLAVAAETAAQEAHLAGLAGQDAEDGLHQGALAGPVRAHQGRVGFSHQLEADVIDRRDSLAPHAQVADFENHFGHFSTLPRRPLAGCRHPNLWATRMDVNALDPDRP